MKHRGEGGGAILKGKKSMFPHRQTPLVFPFKNYIRKKGCVFTVSKELNLRKDEHRTDSKQLQRTRRKDTFGDDEGGGGGGDGGGVWAPRVGWRERRGWSARGGRRLRTACRHPADAQ